MDAEDMLLREFLGIREAAASERSAVWIRSKQREDGSWANFHGGPGDLSTTIEAYVALRLAGDVPDAAHMRSAAAFVRSAGGLERARVFTHIWLALFGAWPWSNVPELPPELMLLPARAPISIYDFACWARQTVVALSIVLSEKPVRPLPFRIDELHGPHEWTRGRAHSTAARILTVGRPRTGCLRAGCRCGHCGRRGSLAPNAGSCAARRLTARGAASSRRGCTR